MRVLLVGSSGLISSAATRAFLTAGHDVVALSRGRRAAISAAGRTSTPLVADRADAESLAAAIEGDRFDATIDFLAFDGPDVERLFHVPRASLGRYVMISSGQVYLVTDSPRPPFREADADRPLMAEPEPGTRDHAEWRYGVGKRRAEASLRALRASHGVRGMALRIPVVQSPEDGRASARLWAYLERMRDGRPLLLPDGGAHPVRFVHADDVAAALVSIAARETWPADSALNLAMPDEPTLREFLERAAEAAGARPEFASVSLEAWLAEGLAAASPYSGRWCSRPDPTRAITDWSLVPRPSDAWLADTVRAHLAATPLPSHPGYALRERELAWAASLGAIA